MLDVSIKENNQIVNVVVVEDIVSAHELFGADNVIVDKLPIGAIWHEDKQKWQPPQTEPNTIWDTKKWKWIPVSTEEWVEPEDLGPEPIPVDVAN